MLVAVKNRLRLPASHVLLTVARARGGPAGAALCYHRVGDPQGRAGDRLVPALGTRLFAEQLAMLAARFRLVPAAELPAAAAEHRRGARLPLAVTFDDDLACHADVSLELLARHSVPATFFVGGAALDGPRPFFWEVLQAALDAGLAADDALLPRVPDPAGAGGTRRLSDAVGALPRDERDALTATLVERVGGPPEPGLRAAGVRRLVDAGFQLGFHTRDHEDLRRLGDRELAAALRDGRGRLEAIAGRPLTALAYPFGLADRRVAAAARAAGFTAGYTLEREPLRPGGDPLLIGRFQPSFVSAGHTAMELARPLTAARRAPAPRGPAR